MKLVVLACLLIPAHLAHADPAETAVRAVIGTYQSYVGSGGDALDGQQRLAGIRILGPEGSEITAFDGALLAFPQASPGPYDSRSITAIAWKLDSLAITTDEARGVAWFQAPVTVDIQVPYSGMQCCQSTIATLRASGIVVRDDKDKTWHVATLALSRQLSDAALFRGATDDIPDGEPTADGSALAKAAAGWFPQKGDTLLGKNAGTILAASGTSPTEYAAGPAAAKLVAAWDKLGMRAKSVDARTYGKDNAIGMVTATVGLPYKKRAAPMTLFAIATRDPKGGWRWVSLQWTTTLARPPIAPPEYFQSTNDPHQKR